MNIDENELKKFANLAATWWDPNGDLKTLHQVNPLRISYIKEKVTLSQKKIIDIGCGGGILTDALAKEADVTGIDMNDSLIEVAKLHQLESGNKVEYLKMTAETIAELRPESYDIVTCLEMLEHVPSPPDVINACAKLLKPGGHIFFSTLNRNLKSYAFAVIGAEYILKLLPKHTHDYSKFIKPSELSKFAIEAGLTPKAMKGISYNPFSKIFSLTDDVSINYIFYATKD